jgi:hypothetical protein
VNRTQEEWVQLRDALANERIALEYEDTLDQAMQAQLAIWRSNESVAAATSGIGANLQAITTAWNAAMHP